MTRARVCKTNATALAALVCIFLALPGCEKEVTRTDYFPLRDGNKWEFRLLDRPLLQRLEKGEQITTADSAPDKSDTDAERATSGKPGVARKVTLELRSEVDDLTFKAVYDSAEQVWSKRNGYVGYQNTRGRNYLLILPPHSGYKWVVTGANGDDLFYVIESAAATVETPAGAFNNCIVSRQESRDRTEIFKYWFAPDVGLVRRSKYYLGEEVFRQELTSHAAHPATQSTRVAEEREVKKAISGSNRGSEFKTRSRTDWRERITDDKSL